VRVELVLSPLNCTSKLRFVFQINVHWRAMVNQLDAGAQYTSVPAYLQDPLTDFFEGSTFSSVD